MGVPTSEVGYTPAMPRREDHEVHKGHVVALWGGGTPAPRLHTLMACKETTLPFIAYLSGIPRRIDEVFHMQTTEVYGGMEAYLHTFLTSELNRGEWSASCPSSYRRTSTLRIITLPISLSRLVRMTSIYFARQWGERGRVEVCGTGWLLRCVAQAGC